MKFLQIVFLLILILFTACTGKGRPPAPLPYADVEVSGYSGPAWPALALLKTGENPLWFELGSDGPLLIETPSAASLATFIPWPFARFIIDIQVWDDFLVMAVNRDGFLVLGAAGDDSAGGGAAAILYRVNGSLWNSYTAESFFAWEDKPAVLLYRNDFFIEPGVPPLHPQVYVLDKSSPVPLGASVPALENFPSDRPWEAEVIHRGPGGFWYYRFKEKGVSQAETAYFRTSNLAEAGTRISMGEWRNSNTQEIPGNLERRLEAIINAASVTYPGGVSLIKVISTECKEPLFFSPKTAPDTGEGLLYAYYREADQLALAIFPGGQGFYSSEKEPDVKPFSLAPLPEDFVYTGIAVFGKVLTASWEEQQDANIGAAGIMVRDWGLGTGD